MSLGKQPYFLKSTITLLRKKTTKNANNNSLKERGTMVASCIVDNERNDVNKYYLCYNIINRI